MRALFLDNFRGFRKAYVPLTDVNFFVGENSTGKTSVLALLALLGSPDFWFRQAFTTGEFDLGTFDDLVSAGSTDRRSFSIGYLQCSTEKAARSAKAFAFLLRFVEEDGLPVVSRYSYIHDRQVVHVAIDKRRTSYTTTELTLHQHTHGYAEKLFGKWAHEANSIRHYANPLTRHQGLGRLPLFVIQSEIESQRRKSRKSTLTPGLRLPLGPVVWIAPIRTKPRRTYDEFSLSFSAEGSHTPYLIRALKRSKKSSGAFDKFISVFGRNSGLFAGIGINDLGRQRTSPFSLEVLLGNTRLSLRNVGYGVSQSLPVVVEAYARPKTTFFAIQQPEVHLHPKAQAALGDVFFRLATEEKKCFFIETHSDFAIDRFRRNYRNAATSPDAQVLFFSRSAANNNVESIPILADGAYTSKQPNGFRDFFLKEQLSLLGV